MSLPLPLSRIPLYYIIFIFIYRVYICSAVALFCILAWALACKFSQLNDQLDDLKDNDVDLGVFSVRHSLVCRAVWQLEEYFQNIMLLAISCIFIGAIGCSSFVLYKAFLDANYNYAVQLIAEVTVAFFLLDAVCYVAECLKDKVSFQLIRKRLTNLIIKCIYNRHPNCANRSSCHGSCRMKITKLKSTI